MPTKKTDPRGNSSTITYDSTGFFPSQIQYPTTNGVEHVEHFVYDPNTSQMTSHTDQNGSKTSFTYDSMRRLTGVTYPTGGGTASYSYNDQVPSPTFTYTRQIDDSKSLIETGIVDGFGRRTQTQLASDPAGIDYSYTVYDALGRVSRVSNPYRSTIELTYPLLQRPYTA